MKWLFEKSSHDFDEKIEEEFNKRELGFKSAFGDIKPNSLNFLT